MKFGYKIAKMAKKMVSFYQKSDNMLHNLTKQVNAQRCD